MVPAVFEPAPAARFLDGREAMNLAIDTASSRLRILADTPSWQTKAVDVLSPGDDAWTRSHQENCALNGEVANGGFNEPAFRTASSTSSGSAHVRKAVIVTWFTSRRGC